MITLDNFLLGCGVLGVLALAAIAITIAWKVTKLADDYRQR